MTEKFLVEKVKEKTWPQSTPKAEAVETLRPGYKMKMHSSTSNFLESILVIWKDYAHVSFIPALYAMFAYM
jgi:hypothetical protein